MTPEIALALAILGLSVFLFITERIKMEVVALLVLVTLAVTDLVTPAQALAGFSNSAVITVLAMFIISGGLTRTGIADLIGRQVLRLAGEGEIRLIVVIMITAGVMSAFMNNVGVAAMMLPVVMDIARRTQRPPSRLLMPLAFGSLLGGMLTLIGTPTNILVSDALSDAGLEPFQLFDYTPVGVVILVAGIIFMALIGRYLLPMRDPGRETTAAGKDLHDVYNLQERLYTIKLPPGSPLPGKTLLESRLGAALRLNVVAVLRHGQAHLAPGPGFLLQAGDQLVVQGRPDLLTEMQNRRYLAVEEGKQAVQKLFDGQFNALEGRLAANSPLVGRTLYQSDLRRQRGVNVLSILRNGTLQRSGLQDTTLQAGDRLLLLGPQNRLDALAQTDDFTELRTIEETRLSQIYRLHEYFLGVVIPADSPLAGQTLAESRLGDALGLTALGIIRDDAVQLLPLPDQVLQAGDLLLVQGSADNLLILRALQALQIEPLAAPDLGGLESDQVGLAEVVLSPHTTLAGKSLRQLHFREKYSLSVLAIWRGGRAYRSNLRDMDLRLGDALLVYGTRQKVQVLGREPDFIVLTASAQEPVRLNKAPLALLIMVAVLLPVFMEWLPISISAMMGATLMMLFGCLTMEEAYRYIELKAIFLIAGMLPLGVAMEQTGAAALLAETVLSATAAFGPLAVVASLFLLTAAATQVMPSAAVAVLMTPIALSAAADQGLSATALVMVVALATAATFLSPVSHPANVLIMGPGGYRFADYVRVGLPLTFIIMLITLFVMPLFWPLVIG